MPRGPPPRVSVSTPLLPNAPSPGEALGTQYSYRFAQSQDTLKVISELLSDTTETDVLTAAQNSLSVVFWAEGKSNSLFNRHLHWAVFSFPFSVV